MIQKKTSIDPGDRQTLALGLEYVGSFDRGWQRQPHGSSLQQHVETALSVIANHPVRNIVCAGRTDAGVHATAQVIHFQTTALRPVYAWMAGTNSLLPPQIRVQWARCVPDHFSARFSALTRRYRYFFYKAHVHSALWDRRAVFLKESTNRLDLEAMQEAAQQLVGEYDFAAFRSSACQAKTSIRRVDFIEVCTQGRWIYIDIQANAFLHHMVRNIVGVLLQIGRGQQSVSAMQAVLNSRDRRCAGITEKPHGLYLVQVRYPAIFDIPMDLKCPFSV
jgi:tRNA pseudouridine38-40 synthase